MARYVEVLHDQYYWTLCDTDELVISRTADPCWRKTWGGDYGYPAPVALWKRPKGGDSAHRISRHNWLQVKRVNTPEAWKAARKNNGGWLNWAQNKEWAQGEIIPEDTELLPVVEGITSIYARHKLLELRSGSARIEAYDPKKPIPEWHTPQTHPHLWVKFRSINDDGRVGFAPGGKEFWFPIFTGDGECWIDLETAKLTDELPQSDWEPVEEPVEEEEPVTTPNFVDFHYGEGKADFSALLAAVDGAVVKCGDGYFMPVDRGEDGKWNWYLSDPSRRWHYDPYFLENWYGLQRAKIRGAYWFLRLNYDNRPWDPDAGIENQAYMFYKRVVHGGLKSTDFIVADIEQSPGQIDYLSVNQKRARVKRFLDECERLFKRRPIIYTYPSWWQSQIGVAGWELGYQLWIADYTPPVWVPAPWKTYWAHQYSDDGRVPGLQSAADLNVYGDDFVMPKATPQTKRLQWLYEKLKRIIQPIGDRM